MIGDQVIGLFLNVQLLGLVKVIFYLQALSKYQNRVFRENKSKYWQYSICRQIKIHSLFLDQCPDDDTNYALIEGVCYYFEKGKKWHSMAQENCNNHIVNGTRGRLFEPRSLATNDLVFSNFTSVHGNQHIFIGIDAIAQHNKWVYSSS